MEYEEVLEPLAKQYDNIEKRKEKSREKIAGAWGERWERQIGNKMPSWQSEHLLQHLSALAVEFSDIEKVMPVFDVTIKSRSAGFKTKKGEVLTPRDVKFSIMEMRKPPEMDEERDEIEDEDDNKENSEQGDDELGDEEAEEGAPQRQPTPQGPPRKRIQSSAEAPSPTPPTSACLILQPLPQTSYIAELRSQLKEKWGATD